MTDDLQQDDYDWVADKLLLLSAQAAILRRSYEEGRRIGDAYAASLRDGEAPHTDLERAANVAWEDDQALEIALMRSKAISDALSSAHCTCLDCGDPDPAMFMVHDELWAAQMSADEQSAHICWTCFETLVGGGSDGRSGESRPRRCAFGGP